MSAVAVDLATLLPKDCLSGATLWIGGAWSQADSGGTMVTIDPSTGQELLRFSKGGASDVDRAVAAAAAAAPAWAAMDGSDRALIMRRAADVIRVNAGRLGTLDTIDCGRVISDTTANAEGIARMLEFYAGLTDKIRGSAIDMGPAKTGLVEREPYGVVGAISPWNYPMLNAMTKIAPIIACGNAIVIKPAEQTPLSVLLIAELFAQAGLPAGVLNVVTGLGTEAGAALVEHPGVPKISFTGSTATGRHIASRAGANLKAVTLELGGKSPLIVFDDADLESAASGAVQTVFMNQGQTCTSCARVLVARSLVPAFVDLCKQKVAAIKIGDPLDATTQLGPLVSEQQLARVRALTDQGIGDGAVNTVKPSPNYRPSEGGYYFPPMIVTDLPASSAMAQQEIFGPVMAIEAFDHDDEAYARANDTLYGLAASVWTTSLARAETARRQIDAGVIWINCVHTLSFNTPVPGHKASGLGSEYGIEVVENYMKLKTTVTMFGGFRGAFG